MYEYMYMYMCMYACSRGLILPLPPLSRSPPAFASQRLTLPDWGCRAPFLAGGGLFGLVPSLNDGAARNLSTRLLAFLASPLSEQDGWLAANASLTPVRAAALAAAPPAAATVSYDNGSYGGFAASDVAAYLGALRDAYGNPATGNVAPDLQAPAAARLR
jgi:hypothetical protein